jgi:hypothetical protein
MPELPEDRSSDENRTPNLNPADFGISEQESNEMKGRALGQHIFDTVEMAMTGEQGGFKNIADADRLRRMRDFPAHMFAYDEDGDPYVHHRTGEWQSVWRGGGYIDHIHDRHGCLDVTNLIDYSDPNGPGPFSLTGPSLTPEKFVQHHNNFLQRVKDVYPKEYQ